MSSPIKRKQTPTRHHGTICEMREEKGLVAAILKRAVAHTLVSASAGREVAAATTPLGGTVADFQRSRTHTTRIPT